MRTIGLNIEDYYFIVDYKFDKGEPMIRYYEDGSGYPGSGADVDIYSVALYADCSYDDVITDDILPILSEYIIEKIKEKIIEEHER